MTSGLSHITFIVKNLEKSASFWKKVFYAEEVYSSGESTYSLSQEKFLRVNGLWICLMEGNPLTERTYSHIAFNISEEDFFDFLSRIKEAGAEIREDRKRVPGEGKSIYFYDYDNHLFELHTGTLENRLFRYDKTYSPLFNRIDELLAQKGRVICAIDGHCASGKTRLAARLKDAYNCNVFAMDDFFLRPFQRTDERLAEAGGNVDYERFSEEVLKPLLAGAPFSYRPYNCAKQRLAASVRVTPTPVSIIEGVYSLHPRLTDAYDITVFLSVDAEIQKQRLITRNKALYQRFVSEWIPMEHKYFSTFDIAKKCCFVFD